MPEERRSSFPFREEILKALAELPTPKEVAMFSSRVATVRCMARAHWRGRLHCRILKPFRPANTSASVFTFSSLAEQEAYLRAWCVEADAVRTLKDDRMAPIVQLADAINTLLALRERMVSAAEVQPAA